MQMPRILGWAAALLVVVAVTAGVTWRLGQAACLRQDQADALQGIVAALAENTRLRQAVRHAGGLGSDGEVLSTYLALIRRDGVPRHSAFKRQIDLLIDSNAFVATLANRHLAHDASPAFRITATQFTDYANTVRDRWQTIFEVFMAGGNLPVANPVPPAAFEEAVRAELAAL